MCIVCRCGANPDGLCGDCWLNEPSTERERIVNGCSTDAERTLNERSTDAQRTLNANAMPMQCEGIQRSAENPQQGLLF